MENAKMEAKKRRFAQGVKFMSADEKKAMKAAIYALYDARMLPSQRQHMLDCIIAIASARSRAMRRKASDRETDARRRKLVGARLKTSEAARCAGCAALLGVSVYRFTCDALERACRMVEVQHGLTWDGEGHRSA